MTAAWFDKRITRDKLDEMDQEFTSKYGKVRIVSIDDAEVEPHDDVIIDESEEELDHEDDVVDYDEAAEEEIVEEEKEDE